MENANLFWQSGTENSKRIVGLGGSAQLLGLVEAEAETAARRQRDVARNTGVRSKGFSVCMRRCRPPPTANYSPGPMSLALRRAEVLAAEGLDLKREVTRLVLELDEEDCVILGDMVRGSARRARPTAAPAPANAGHGGQIGEAEADDDVADAMRLAESELVTQKVGAQKAAALGGRGRWAQSPTTTRARPDRAQLWWGDVEELGERLGEALQVGVGVAPAGSCRSVWRRKLRWHLLGSVYYHVKLLTLQVVGSMLDEV
jgi:hypothetical protein